MKVGVGSTNPVKIAATREAVQEVVMRLDPDALNALDVQGFDVESGVSVQPHTDSETRTGARQRAQVVLDQNPSLDLAVGLEGGVYEDLEENRMYTTVWVCAMGKDKEGNLREAIANGGRIPVPSKVAEGIRAGGEMGPVIDLLLNQTNTKHGQGLFGVVTRNVVPRQREYQTIAVMAVALWFVGETELG